MDKLWTEHGQIMDSLWADHGQIMDRLGTHREQVREIWIGRTAIWSGENCHWLTPVIS